MELIKPTTIINKVIKIILLSSSSSSAASSFTSLLWWGFLLRKELPRSRRRSGGRTRNRMPRHGQFIMGPAAWGSRPTANTSRSTRRLCGAPCTSSTSTRLRRYSPTRWTSTFETVSVQDVGRTTLAERRAAVLHGMANNLSWLEEQLDEFGEDAYFLFDCPGQIELFPRSIMKLVLRHIISHYSVGSAAST